MQIVKTSQVLATLPNGEQENGKNHGGTKEMTSAFSLVVHTPEGLAEAVTVRVWMGRSSNSSRVYASLWARGPRGSNRHASGYGVAGGYGYHKQSQAIADAVKSAGFAMFGTPYNYAVSDLTKPFDFGGTGSSAYPEIFGAIAQALGHNIDGAIMIEHGA